MRLHVLQHVPFEGSGRIETWARRRGHPLAVTRLYAGDPFPPPGAADWIIALGGPMSVHDRARHPWLRAETGLLRDAMRAGRHVLGICLGAQLMAAALGARVRPNGHREIGWFPVRRPAGTARHPLLRGWPGELDVFHWHGEGFDLPRRAVPLFASEATPVQAFAWGPRAVALQFHLEMRPADARRLVRRAAEDLRPGRFVQAPGAMLAEAARFARAGRWMDRLLDAMARS